MQIKTAGELRGFLADIMVGIRDGKVDTAQAHAISKVAAQINQSLAVEVNTALQLERMGKDHPVAGTMLIGMAGDMPPAAEPSEALPAAEAPKDKPETGGELARIDHSMRDDLVWCDQCDARVAPEDAAGCKSRRCSLKVAA